MEEQKWVAQFVKNTEHVGKLTDTNQYFNVLRKNDNNIGRQLFDIYVSSGILKEEVGKKTDKVVQVSQLITEWDKKFEYNMVVFHKAEQVLWQPISELNILKKIMEYEGIDFTIGYVDGKYSHLGIIHNTKDDFVGYTIWIETIINEDK